MKSLWVVDDKEVNFAGFFNENLIVEETKATMKALAIVKNRINFLRLPEKNSNTNASVYGILNDPELLPMITVPANKEGNIEWKDKTIEEIFNNIGCFRLVAKNDEFSKKNKLFK